MISPRPNTLCALLATTAFALSAAACGGGEGEPGAAEGEATIELAEQSGSGQKGTAVLSSTGEGMTKVVVELSNPPNVPQPAHIHHGTCDELDPTPAYTLTELSDGRSETSLSVALEDLRGRDLVINVHASVAEIATYAACGAIL
jgi:hypothetical protein